MCWTGIINLILTGLWNILKPWCIMKTGKNSIKEFLSENTSYLAYQIAEHGGRTGEKFITTTRKEFWRMFQSAAGGGIIISFIGIIKNLLGKMGAGTFLAGLFVQYQLFTGFYFDTGYGSTLATKQPAYTANNVAVLLMYKK
jgi:site-specific recombinase